MSETQEFVIRVATPADDAALLAVEQAAFSAKAGFPSTVKDRGSPFFSDRNPPAAHLVADAGGELLGYVRLKPQLDGVPECSHVLAIHGLDVSPRARRRGVATALMRAAEQTARDRGARKLSLRVFGGNDTARVLYESLGYVVEGVLVEEFLIEGEYVDDVLMTLRLT